MSPAPDSTLEDPQQVIDDLQRKLADAQQRLEKLAAERDEALAQQAASAEVLGVINSSPGNLAPVFDAILGKAMSLCGIALGALQLYEEGKFRAVAVRGVARTLAELLREPIAPIRGAPPARLLSGEPFVHILDMAEVAEQLVNALIQKFEQTCVVEILETGSLAGSELLGPRSRRAPSRGDTGHSGRVGCGAAIRTACTRGSTIQAPRATRQLRQH